MKGRLHQFTESKGSLLPVALFRLTLGFMLWRHAWFFLDNYFIDRFYQDKFYLPYFDWYPLPSEGFYLFILGLMIVCGCFLIVGYRSREAAWIAFASVTFHLLLNQFWYRHNRYFFLLMLLLLAVGPGHRIFSWPQNKQVFTGHTWSYFMIRIQMTLTYIASAFAKTLDEDWRSGNVLKERLNYVFREGNMGGENLPFEVSESFQRIARSEMMGNILTVLALGQEYLLAICLWLPRTRKLALWVGAIFHGSIELGANVLVFSYASLATYFVVIRPTTADRKVYFDPNRRSHRTWVKLLAACDWLDKLSFYETTTDVMVVEDRDGQFYRGWFALAIAGSCLVLPYLLAYPLTWLKHFGVGRYSPDQLASYRKVVITTTVISNRTFLWVMLTGIVAYQVFMLLITQRITPFNLQALSGFDAIVMMLIFLVAWCYYRPVNRELP